MIATKKHVGFTLGHALQAPRAVTAYTLDNERGLAITVWTYGASLIEVLTKGSSGKLCNMVVRRKSLAEYEDPYRKAYLGATMGRYARCIAGGRACLDGREYHFHSNYGGHHLHGGPLGFDAFVWDADVKINEKGLTLTLYLVRPDGEQGYPGEIQVQTKYILKEDNSLEFEHRATTTKSTFCDITNHAMWNLSDSKNTIDEHFLAVKSKEVLLVNEDLIPEAAPTPALGTELNFYKRKMLGRTILDNCYIFEGDISKRAAVLQDPGSGRSMTVYTDQPGLQTYSADNFEIPRAGLCLQAGSWPNAPIQPNFPSARLDPCQVYMHRTIHKFTGLSN